MKTEESIHQFTKSEDKDLVAGVSEFGREWKKIRKHKDSLRKHLPQTLEKRYDALRKRGITTLILKQLVGEKSAAKQGEVKQGEAKQTKTPFTEEEIAVLKAGVRKHGKGHWTRILVENKEAFHHTRTSTSLSNKWRTLAGISSYKKQDKKRTFVYATPGGVPESGPDKRPVTLKNKFQYEAALKLATKDFIYAEGKSKATVHILDKNTKTKAFLHVYECTREVVNPPTIPKFSEETKIYVGRVRKIKTIRLD
ncbi:MAG: uncharacterized protein A8A55_0849 [Amphiamblys sp. WSBS2006]|nr:MAG: uncharacterized protein A8A55_0849 [Amphiamblys sp. WSBS2006]